MKFKFEENIFKWASKTASLCVVALTISIVVVLIKESWLAIKTFKFDFWTTKIWDPVFENFGALPFAYGTLLTSLLAVAISLPISIGFALFCVEYAPEKIKDFFITTTSLIASIPSAIFGLWGIFVLGPFLQNFILPLTERTIGFLPFFQGHNVRFSYLTATIILSIMITPTITSIAIEAFQTVSKNLKDSLYSLGATKWEMIRYALLKTTKTTIFAATILGFGRAVGETMATAMVIGNVPIISTSLFSAGSTIASAIANEFTEATTDIYLSSLFYLAMVLFFITLATNFIAKFLLKNWIKR